MSRITPLVRPNIAALTPYSTARDEYDGPIGIFLDANESPYENGYNRYPDPHQAELKARIGGIKGIPVKNLFLGTGTAAMRPSTWYSGSSANPERTMPSSWHPAMACTV